MPTGRRKGGSGLAIETIPRLVLARLLCVLLSMLLLRVLLLLLCVLLLVLYLRRICGIAAVLLHRILARSHVERLSGIA